MGTWGNEPWDNDSAADWMATVFSKSGFASEVVSGLNADLVDSPEVVRAAAHLVFMLGRPYVWPIERLNDDLQLTVSRLESLIEQGWKPKRQLQKELKELQARIESLKPQLRPEPEPVRAPTDATVPQLELLWKLDLATEEQRHDCSGLGWHVSAAYVDFLQTVEKKYVLAHTRNHCVVVNAVTGKPYRDLWTDERRHLDQVLFAQKDHFIEQGDSRITVRSIANGKVLFEQRFKSRIAACSVSDEGTRLVVLTFAGKLSVFDLPNCNELFTAEHSPPKNAGDASVAISLDSSRVASSWRGSVCFWDLSDGKLLKKSRNKFAGVSFTPDGLTAATRAQSGTILWDTMTGKKLGEIDGAVDGSISNFVISPTNRYVCEVSGVRFHQKLGDITSVRDWTEGDIPYRGTPRVDFLWLPENRLATWSDVSGEGSTCELRVWSVDPLQLLATRGVERCQFVDGCGKRTSNIRGDFMRLAVSEDGTTIFVGDSDAHVYAFRVP